MENGVLMLKVDESLHFIWTYFSPGELPPFLQVFGCILVRVFTYEFENCSITKVGKDHQDFTW